MSNNILSMSMMVENRKISNEISIPKTSPSICGEENTIVECVEEFFVEIVLIDGV